MGWKMIYLARRNPALAPEQFAQAWREHSALGARCSNVRDKVRSVAQCARVLEAPALPGCSADYDGVNLLELRDLAAATDIWSDAETLAIMRPDEPRVFSTYVREFTLVCQDQVLADAARGDAVLVGFLRRTAALSADDWSRTFTQLTSVTSVLCGGALASAGRVVHNAVHLPPPPGYAYDSIVEWWFDSVAAMRAAVGDRDVRQALPAPLCAATDLDRSVFMATRVTHRRP